MLVSLHNHTTMSDGEAPLEEMIRSAAAQGVDEIGISDHLTWYPDARAGDPPVWSMAVGFLDEYAATLRAAALQQRSAPVLRVGIEVDFFPENAAAIKARLDPLPFDYVIASVHFVDAFALDAEAKRWEALSVDERNQMWRRYWLLVAECAASRLGDFIGHLDLPKKFGFLPTIDLTREVEQALDAIAAAGQGIEINTSGWHLPAAEAYPSPALLQSAHRRGIPLLINADAHAPGNLRRDFERARELARSAGYRELVRFEGRKMIPYGL